MGTCSNKHAAKASYPTVNGPTDNNPPRQEIPGGLPKEINNAETRVPCVALNMQNPRRLIFYVELEDFYHISLSIGKVSFYLVSKIHDLQLFSKPYLDKIQLTWEI